jgi:energy-coupling factor transporter ATP-binding protein EcfA2
MTEQTQINRRYFLEAEQIAKKLSAFFERRNLKPLFTNLFLFQDLGMTILIAVLDTNRIGDHAQYIQDDLLHQLKTELGGRSVYLSNSTGIRYVILLTALPKLPRSIELPTDVPNGMVSLGMRFNGQIITLPWSKLGHLLIVGMTGSGKSSLLRSLAIQAIRNGIKLLLADIDQTTFAMLDGHENLFAPITTSPQQALDLIMNALAECDHRVTLYKSLSGFPENMDEYNALAVKAGKEPLSRILVMLDESSSVFKAMGGGSGELAGKLAELGWRGRKFGIHFIFGAQEFTKDLVGAVREQVNMSIAFRVKPTSAQMAKAIGCTNAHRIPADRPGFAIVDRFGPMQSYFVPKRLLLSAGSSNQETLPALERNLFSRAIENADGKMTLANIAEWGGVSQHQARKLQSTWALRGWISKDGNRDNSFCITAKTRDLASNRQTAQTASNLTNQSQTQKGDQS